MKNIKVLMWVTALILITGCKEAERGQTPIDNMPPANVSDIVVTNLEGGATLSYTIPNDDDLLYVKAIYRLDDGTLMEQKASAYASELKIEGIGRSRQQTVQVVTGDRSKNESSPLEVIIHPLDAPIYTIARQLTVKEDFGGIRIDWENPSSAQIAIVVTKPDERNNMVDAETFYTHARIGKANVRGYESVEQIFGVHVRDRWGNHTDTLIATYVPIFEQRLDKTKFEKWNPSGIPYTQLDNNWTIDKLWNNSLNDPGFSWPLTAVIPGSFTLDLGQTAKLGRFKLYQRTSQAQLYTGGNVKKFKLYGSPHPGVSADIDSWIFLGDYSSYKPSGLPLGETSAEDLAYAGVSGEDYFIELDEMPEVRYLRFLIEATWGGSRAMQIMEVDFYGEIK